MSTLSQGLLLFIDEADAFLGRRGAGMSEGLRGALNAILFRTGDQSRDFAVVLATNRPGQLAQDAPFLVSNARPFRPCMYSVVGCPSERLRRSSCKAFVDYECTGAAYDVRSHGPVPSVATGSL